MRIENARSEEVMFTNTISVTWIELVSDTGERVRLPGPDSDRIRVNSGRRDLTEKGPLLPIEVIGLDASGGEDSREGSPISEFSPIRIRPGESANFLLRYFPNAQRRFETQRQEGLPFDLKSWRIEAALRLSRPELDETALYHSFALWARAK